MKKFIISTFIIFLLVSCIVYAKTVKEETILSFMHGVVTKVSFLNSRDHAKNEIIVETSSGEKFNIVIDTNTAIHGNSFKLTTVNRINEEDFVKISYIQTAEGLYLAKSVALKR